MNFNGTMYCRDVTVQHTDVQIIEAIPLSLPHSSITMSQTALYNESYSPVSCMYQHSLCLPVIKGCGACGQSKAKKPQVCI